MAFGKIFSRSEQHAIQQVEPDDSGEMARLHLEGFGRPWSDGEFAALLEKGTVFGFVARREGKKSASSDGFVLARLVEGEAEILTIAVAKSKRGRGLGRALMDTVLRHLHAERAEMLFLEVDEGNTPAVALYRRLGFYEVSRREAYYDDKAANDGTALVMRLDLQ